VLSIWSKEDPKAAAEFLLTLPLAEWCKNPQFDLARKYARRDVAGALQWTRRLPAGVKQEEVIGVIVEEWAKNKPAGAKKFAGNAPAGAATYIPAFARSQWHAQQRSREALRIASELRPGELREETLAYLSK
jgi:hypothetical protein